MTFREELPRKGVGVRLLGVILASQVSSYICNSNGMYYDARRFATYNQLDFKWKTGDAITVILDLSSSTHTVAFRKNGKNAGPTDDCTRQPLCFRGVGRLF